MLSSALNFLTDKRRRFLRAETVPVFDPDQINFTPSSLISSSDYLTEPSVRDENLGFGDKNELAEGGKTNELEQSSHEPEKSFQRQRREIYSRTKKSRGNSHTITGFSTKTDGVYDELMLHETCNLSQLKLPSRDDFIYGSPSLKGREKFSHSDSSDSIDRRNATAASLQDTGVGLETIPHFIATKDLKPADQLPKDKTHDQSINCEPTANNFERYQTANQKRNAGTSHGRVAQIRAKAAVRAAGKARNLHRSRSSAQIHHDNQPTPNEAAGGQARSSSTHRDKLKKTINGVSKENLTVPSSRKARCEKRSKTWLDKTVPRSRSAASHALDFQTPTSRNSKQHHHKLSHKSLLLGTSVMPQKIHSSDCWRNEARHLALSGQRDQDQAPTLVTSADGTEQNFSLEYRGSNILLAPPVDSNQLKWNDKPSKRRLRRNNSSNYHDRLNFASKNGNKSNIYPTVFTAGDLMLPSNILFLKEYQQQNISKSQSDTVADEILDLIEHEKLMQLVDKIDGCELDVHQLLVASGLSLLDCACLLSSPEVILFFITHNFEPGTWLKTTMDKGPIPSRLKDPIKFHLSRKVAEADDNLKLARAITLATVNHANEMKMSVLNLKNMPEGNDELNSALLEIERAEVNFSECSRIKNRFLKLFNGLDRFPSLSLPPSKVSVVVLSNNSLLVRVGQPRMGDFAIDQETSDCEYSDLSSEENSSRNTSCHGRHFTEKSHLQFSKLALRYRIEWSTSKDFGEEDLQYCLVRPPFRQVQVQEQVDIGRLLKTGFYELCDLASNVEVYVRVFAFSIRGWSEPCYCQPASLKPSAWFTYNHLGGDKSGQSNTEDLPEQRQPFRYIGSELETELTQAKLLLDRFLLNWHVKQATESRHLNIDGGNDDGIISKRSKSPILQRKRSFRFLFPNKTVKFVKQTKSGIYMALLCYAPILVNQSNMDIRHSECISTPVNYGDIKESFQLVTTDDGLLPMLNVTKEDLTAQNNFYMDINWMARLLSGSNNCTEIQLISEQLSHGSTPANLQFRVSLLTAIHRLQSSLGSSDVGQFYPEMFRAKVVESVKKQSLVDGRSNSETIATDGFSNEDISDSGMNTKSELQTEASDKPQNTSTLLLFIKNRRDVKSVNLSSGLKWCTMQKFLRQNKITLESSGKPANGQSTSTEPNRDAVITRSTDGMTGSATSFRGDQLILTPESHLVSRLESLLWYSERRGRRLKPGLYVAYIQMQASLDQQPTVLGCISQDVINILPVERVRYRSHVTYTEWGLLHALVKTESPAPSVSSATVEDIRFLRKLYVASSRLSKQMSTSGSDLVDLRLYLPEVIQISPKHAFILAFPPADQVCLAPLQKVSLPPNCYWQPMSHFERNLSATYDPVYFSRISNLTALLEVLVPMSLFLQRQCFTDAEITQGVQRTSALQSLQRDLDATYQNNRWLGMAISTARDRKRPGSLTLSFSILLAFIKEYSADDAKELKSSTPCPDKDVAVGEKPCDADYVHERGMGILQVYATYSSGLPMGTSIRLLMSMSTTASEVVALVVKRLAEVVQQQRFSRQQKAIQDSCDSDDTNREHCLTVSLANGLEYFLPGHFRPLLLRQPWRTGRFTISTVNRDQVRKPSIPFMVRGEMVHPLEQVKYTEPIRVNSLHICAVANPFGRAHVVHIPTIHCQSTEDKLS